MKHIYLDQNKWILLAQGLYKGEGEVYDLVCELKKKIEKGEVMIVLSLINLEETLKRMEEKSRNRLLEFIFDLSQGNTISPFRDWVIDDEVENLFLKKLNKRINIKSKVIRQGVSGIIGMEASIKGDIPKEVKAKAMEKINSLETFKVIFSSQESADRARDYASFTKQKTLKFEDVRRKERIHKNKKIQFEEGLKIFFRDFVLKRYVRFCFKYRFPVLRSDMSINEVEDSLKKLPATYTYFSLIDRRDRELHRKIKANDLNDLFSFTMGIAYCDIIFGEKMFVDMAKKSKLDGLYKTLITSSLEEFRKAIEN